jgi:hypothetical protein
VRAWLKNKNFDEKYLLPICCLINNWNCSDLTCFDDIEILQYNSISAFIKKEKNILKIAANEVNSDVWREKNLDKVVYYYYNILQQKKSDESIRASSSSTSSDKNHWERKGFTLAPICDIKRYFVTIGKEGLTCLLNNAAKLVKMPKRKPQTAVLKNDTVEMKLSKHILIDAEIESDWLHAFNFCINEYMLR